MAAVTTLLLKAWHCLSLPVDQVVTPHEYETLEDLDLVTTVSTQHLGRCLAYIQTFGG